MRKIALLLPFALGGAHCLAQSDAAPSVPKLGSVPYEINGQLTYIAQSLFPFHSSYTGPLSLVSRRETEWTETYTLYLGLRPMSGVDLYVDPEWSLGAGISGGTGLAAYTNGDVLRIPGS